MVDESETTGSLSRRLRRSVSMTEGRQCAGTATAMSDTGMPSVTASVIAPRASASRSSDRYFEPSGAISGTGGLATSGGGTLTLGGSVRVGLEDNFYLPDGEMARSNGDLIAKARQLVHDCGRRPATVQEARALLGVAERAPASARAPAS